MCLPNLHVHGSGTTYTLSTPQLPDPLQPLTAAMACLPQQRQPARPPPRHALQVNATFTLDLADNKLEGPLPQVRLPGRPCAYTALNWLPCCWHARALSSKMLRAGMPAPCHAGLQQPSFMHRCFAPSPPPPCALCCHTGMVQPVLCPHGASHQRPAAVPAAGVGHLAPPDASLMSTS